MNRLTLIVVPFLVLALLAGTGLAAQPETPPSVTGQTASAGPPADLPDPVPDFVGEILGSIQQFIDGVLEGDLGATVSEIAGSEPADGT